MPPIKIIFFLKDPPAPIESIRDLLGLAFKRIGRAGSLAFTLSRLVLKSK